MRMAMFAFARRKDERHEDPPVLSLEWTGLFWPDYVRCRRAADCRKAAAVRTLSAEGGQEGTTALAGSPDARADRVAIFYPDWAGDADRSGAKAVGGYAAPSQNPDCSGRTACCSGGTATVHSRIAQSPVHARRRGPCADVSSAPDAGDHGACQGDSAPTAPCAACPAGGKACQRADGQADLIAALRGDYGELGFVAAGGGGTSAHLGG